MSIRSVSVIVITAVVIGVITIIKSKINSKKDLEDFNKTVHDNEEHNILGEQYEQYIRLL